MCGVRVRWSQSEGLLQLHTLAARHHEVGTLRLMSRTWHSTSPLLAINDPHEVWTNQPTFFIAEFLFLSLAAWGIIDALHRPRGALTFVSCLVGGAAVELVTILHGEVGNFYHSQATVMLFGRREPLYMLLGCYGWIAHVTMLLSKRLGGSMLHRAAFAALLGSEAWALLDTVGARFLWWTWHNSEPLYDDREGGVPVASSFWIMASMGSLAIVIERAPDHACWGLLAGPLATLGLMHVPFMAIFHPLVTAGGFHASYAMWAFRGLCLLPLFSRLGGPPRTDPPLFRQMAAFAISSCLIACFADPAHETRTSFSQPCLRRCGEIESSFWGAFTRKATVCPADNQPARDLYRICDSRCDAARTPLEMYTTCGVPAQGGWVAMVLTHATVVLMLAALPFQAPGATAAGRVGRGRPKAKAA
jgi:hypothetical protein